MENDNILNSPMQYLDKALVALRDMGLVPEDQESQEAPIVSLLNQISELDEDRVVAIARTLSQASFFNDVVRNQVAQMKVGERYEEITQAFDSIREDAKEMVDQLEDGTIDVWERAANMWMKVSRGDIASRFDDIKNIYLEVAADSKDQIAREQTILNAYRDFRGALKQAEVMALEVLETGAVRLDTDKG
ncbi:MAG: cell surface protein, partial [Alphaproteobacteria bacterium]